MEHSYSWRWSPHESISALIKGTPTLSILPLYEDGEKTIVSELGSGLSADTEFASDLIVEFPTSRTARHTLLLIISHPVDGILSQQLEWLKPSF